MITTDTYPSVILIDILNDCLCDMLNRPIDAKDIIDVLKQLRLIRANMVNTVAPSQAAIPPLKWSEEREPSSTIRYNHVVSNCALGPISIEWKGWKEYDSYVTYVDGEYLNTDSTLEAAKARVGIHLHMIAQSLSQGLDN